MVFRVTKTYGHNLGLSCCFRQWRADRSHCKYLHGYAIQVTLTFESDVLDQRNWVIDFGGLKQIKTYLERMFDHKTLVAVNDPEYNTFRDLHSKGIIDMVSVYGTGCERFAEMIHDYVDTWLKEMGYDNIARLANVEVREHGANAASFSEEKGTHDECESSSEIESS